MKTLPLNPASKLLLGISLLLIMVLVYMAFAPASSFEFERGKGGGRPVKSKIEVKTFTPPSMQGFLEVDKRPLFSPLRKPAKIVDANEEEQKKKALTPPAFTLVGVVIDGADKMAIVKGAQEAKSLKIGDDYEGWKVEMIEPNRLLMRANEVDQEYKLYKDDGPSQGIIDLKSEGAKSLAAVGSQPQ